MSKTTYLALHDLLPKAEPEYDLDKYRRCEHEVLTPALEALGYEVGGWFTGDGDSFGPLTRCVRVTKDNKSAVVVYG
jgi:hypothetical protein